MVQSERNPHSINRGGERTKLSLKHLYWETYRKPSEQLFPNRRPLSYPNFSQTLLKHENARKVQTTQKSNSTIETTTEVSPWNDY